MIYVVINYIQKNSENTYKKYSVIGQKNEIDENKYYLECLSKNENNISKCIEFFNILDKCKNSNNN